ncbi:MAG: anti-sigma factor domain-containing protein [Sedimentibacter saalensis]|uniref:anti-sigma factor domain-containing protein n=1 Tax=Sedimentibacter saalensis TaxID=130788 RepID=UPI002B1F3BDE|nr:anti-sigma factor domain-containing protein [Sedimentibacter saalensis]MEA5093902.1 anti-sigma factor domain-containing protein [Sedimentibacter saalensis]
MKGIVIEINNNQAAVLSDNGAVVRIKNKNYETGQVVRMKENKMNFIKKAGSIAAVLAVTAAGSFAYALPATYVSLDVNPSIEYTVNTFGRVLSVKAVNDDGEVITTELDVKNVNISKAVKVTIDKLREGGYITDDEDAGIVITISGKNDEKAEELAEKLEEETKEYVEEIGETAEVEVEAVGKERVEEARSLGVTPGKLNLVQKLVKSTEGVEGAEEIDMEEWLDKSVKEINKAIKENRKQLKETSKAVEEADEEDAEEANTADEDKIEDKTEETKVKNNKGNEKNKVNNIKNNKNDDIEDVEDEETEEAEAEENEDESKAAPSNKTNNSSNNKKEKNN